MDTLRVCTSQVIWLLKLGQVDVVVCEEDEDMFDVVVPLSVAPKPRCKVFVSDSDVAKAIKDEFAWESSDRRATHLKIGAFFLVSGKPETVVGILHDRFQVEIVA